MTKNYSFWTLRLPGNARGGGEIVGAKPRLQSLVVPAPASTALDCLPKMFAITGNFRSVARY